MATTTITRRMTLKIICTCSATLFSDNAGRPAAVEFPGQAVRSRMPRGSKRADRADALLRSKKIVSDVCRSLLIWLNSAGGWDDVRPDGREADARLRMSVMVGRCSADYSDTMVPA